MFISHAIKIPSALRLLAILLILLVTLSAHAIDDPTDAGTVITNRAEATYNDEAGGRYSVVSATITVTVLNVAKVVVTPDETVASETIAPHDEITRLFQICNSGNNPDTFSLSGFVVTAPATQLALYFDNDGSGTVTKDDAPITLNETASPSLAPRKCIGALAVINTNDLAAHSTLTITLSARSNSTNSVNGRGEDTGTIVNAVGVGVQLTDPNNPALPPSKSINGLSQTVVTQSGEFSYTIAFKNSGDTAGRNISMRDLLPPEIGYSPGSLLLNDRSLSDALDADQGSVQAGVIQVHLAHLDPGEVVRIAFRARLIGTVPSGTGVVNTAVVSADNAQSLSTSAATVIVNPFGTLYAGRAGSSAPVAGARIQILVDQNQGNLLPLPPDKGFAPNEKNENPFVTDSQGHFSFVLATTGTPQTYFMQVAAQGYLPRNVQLTISPATGVKSSNSSSVGPALASRIGPLLTNTGLFSVNMHALDNQPLAVPGGFDLIREDVSINDLAALVMNIPLFEPTGLQLLKSSDRGQAEIGDMITYRLEVHNPTSAAVRDIVIKDHLPPSFHFAEGSGLIRLGTAPGEPVAPQIVNGDLQFRIAEIPHGATAHLLYRVRVGANASEGDQVNLAVAAGTFPSGEQTVTATAHAIVKISAGAFSTRQVIVGRVFVDTNGNGHFDDQDRGAAGIRLFLTNGQSVITDSAGLYNFPSLGDGPQVVSLDPVTLPPSYALADRGREADKGWTRLLRTPVGGGALLRQNFILVEKTKPVISLPLAPSAPPQPTPSPESEPSTATSAPVAPASSAASSEKVAAQRTYDIAASDNIEPVAPGEVRIISPAPNSVSMSPGAQIEARTALNWTVRLEVNGQQISDQNIGVKSLDHKNQVATYTFVGISLHPGPNKIRCSAISPDNALGKSQEINVVGRGPATRLEIVTEKSEIQTGGDWTIVHVKAFDERNNPALDGQVGIETSSGELADVKDKAEKAAPSKSANLTSSPAEPGRSASQMVVQLENGEAAVKLIGSGMPGEARLQARTGQLEAEGRVRIIAEMRRPILIGFAEMSFGNSIPEVNLRNEQGNFRSRVSFFYSGSFPGNNMLTISYDTQRPINRTTGRDRLFQTDPLERVYPLFGDSSTRFEAATSNSKLYARIDHKRSFVMFGDFESDMDGPLAGYTRKLTGVKAHLENSGGDFITLTGSRPDTAFARDVFPGGSLGLIQLSHADILPGSETVAIELRDRRNPEVIISREILARSIDYNLDPANGQLFFLRYISTFDRVLNLMQIVVTYEHRAISMSSAVYTGRARKNFKGIGLTIGASAALQREANLPDFFIGGLDLEKTLPRHGLLQVAWASSQGQIAGTGNLTSAGDTKHDGNAYQLALAQPLPFFGSTLRARYLKASAGFFNPFGGTVTPGSRRGEVIIEMKPGKQTVLHFGVTSERNQTVNVDNGRLTFSGALDQIINERIKLHFGFDHRALTDDLNNKNTDSNLITVGAEIQATKKLQLSAKREQNLGDPDPSYPNQTTLAATYQLSALTKLFFTQRLASAPITPIADFTANGFAGVSSRRETAFGVETRFGKYTSMTARYQLENAINGTDSFAVIGLQNHFPLTKHLSLEAGFERGHHLLGPNQSFNSVTTGFGWTPNSDFRASARYEYRDRGGVGQLLALGAAGRLSDGITALSRFQFSRGSFEGRSNESTEGMAALAIRPLESDRVGLLFSYDHRSTTQDAPLTTPTRIRLDSLATDSYYQPAKRLELYGHFALRLTANGQPDLPFVSTTSFLAQLRAQYMLTRRMDWALETRLLFQPSSHTSRTTYATELGFWVTPDLRLAGGYNLTSAQEPAGADVLPRRRGFYFTISSKLSRLFDLFGTSNSGLASQAPEKDKEPDKTEVKKNP